MKIPDGWPTEEMVVAGTLEIPNIISSERALKVAERVFRAMLEAAPTQPAQHSDDEAVDRFAAAMKEKLAKARVKGRGGWDDPERCSVEHLQQLLHSHTAKGDPVDVGNFAMMLHQRGGSTTPPDHIGDATKMAAMDDYNEPAMATNWEHLRAQLNSHNWTAEERTNFRVFFAWGWEARRQYKTPAQEDEPVYLVCGDGFDDGWEFVSKQKYNEANKDSRYKFYTHPESDKLREAAEEVLNCFDSSARYSLGFERACESLRAALEGK